MSDKPLSVSELRIMLQAALEHQERNVDVSGSTSQNPGNTVHAVTIGHEVQHSMVPECETTTSDIEHFSELQKSVHTEDSSISCDSLQIQFRDVPIELEGESNALVIDEVPNQAQKVVSNESQIVWISQACSQEAGNSKSDSNSNEKYLLLKKQYKQLSEQHKKLKQKFSKLEQDKLSSDDYALRLGKELQQLKDKQNVPQAKFTEEEGIAKSVTELEQFNERAESDSMFVGLLIMRLIGAEKLQTMSVTGQASHRFAKLKKPDGTPQYPATERIDPGILEFICNKVAERTAIRVGPENAVTIRKRSEVTAIKKYIAQKIGNLKKAEAVRKARNGTELQDTGNIRV